MLSQPTLLVVGAGASVDLGFPIGTRLRDQIAQTLYLRRQGSDLDGFEPEFANWLSQWAGRSGYSLQDVVAAANTIAQTVSLSSSIDSYLDTHRFHELRSKLAKIAIAYLIMTAENKSALSCGSDAEGSEYSFGSLTKTWYQRLWSVLQIGVTPASPERVFEGLRIMTFNYDRNIERFLQLAYARFFDVTFDAAMRVVDTIGTLHVYGAVGKLSGDLDKCPSYRKNGFVPDLEEAAEEITTFSERVSSDLLDQIRGAVHASQRIIFLGFSFGSANMALFRQALTEFPGHREVYATSHQMYPESVESVRSQLTSMFSQNYFNQVHLHDDRCEVLFDRYGTVF